MFDRELVKGSTSLLLLQLLSEKDMYGYELVKAIEQRSGETFTFKEGTLYPALHKLEQQGFIESYWQSQERGPDRKYYHITQDGTVSLQEKTDQWKHFIRMIGKVIGGEST